MTRSKRPSNYDDLADRAEGKRPAPKRIRFEDIYDDEVVGEIAGLENMTRQDLMNLRPLQLQAEVHEYVKKNRIRRVKTTLYYGVSHLRKTALRLHEYYHTGQQMSVYGDDSSSSGGDSEAAQSRGIEYYYQGSASTHSNREREEGRQSDEEDEREH